ncbi:MAG: YebC/PmpR family DNA-binding transcriptional regulator, partial [Selenomonadaceae bacterium]|nr:YebC/PmpR family DNA-binding transcriptional regulator [Selenomonadaceae bacterium]
DKETFDDEDILMEIAMDAGAEDFSADDEAFEITADPADFNAIEQALADKGIETASAEITQVPDTTVALNDADAEKLQKLLDALDEDDDVQNVYDNYAV